MRITKTATDVAKQKLERTIANMGCHVCPCCGEDKEDIYYIRKGIMNKGIMGGLCSTYGTGCLHIKVMRIDHYHCSTCGAEWESEPYEYN